MIQHQRSKHEVVASLLAGERGGCDGCALLKEGMYGKIIMSQCLPKEDNKEVFHFHHKCTKTYLWCLRLEVICLLRIITVIST